MSVVDLSGQRFSNWLVIKRDAGRKKWICRCNCGEEYSVDSSNLKSGGSTQCKNCSKKDKIKDLSGQKFGKWLVLRRDEKSGGWICCCDCGFEKNVQCSQLRNSNSEGCRNCWIETNKSEDLSNREFNKWTVIGRDFNKSKKLDYWFCKCKCGEEKSIYGSHLRLGKSVSCRKCSEHKHKGRLCYSMFKRIKDRAKKSNLCFELGEKEEAKVFLYKLLHEKQKCCCALTGMPIVLANTLHGSKNGENTASLDRIDSKKGYTKDNVQWVHKMINTMKWDFEQKVFIEFCEAVVRYKNED